jgi:hypothetical protein
MSTQDQPRESGGTTPLEQLAEEGQPVVTDPEDRYGVADDPDALDSNTGRPARGTNDSGTEAAGVGGVANAGGMAGATGTPSLAVPLLEGAREEGAARAEDSDGEEPRA